MNKTLVHITSSPFHGLAAKEGLDLAMVLATFEQEVDLAFSGAGIALLFDQHKASFEQGKDLTKILPSLEFYDIDNLYCPQSAISEKMSITSLATLLPDNEWQTVLTSYQHIFRF